MAKTVFAGTVDKNVKTVKTGKHSGISFYQ